MTVGSVETATINSFYITNVLHSLYQEVKSNFPLLNLGCPQ